MSKLTTLLQSAAAALALCVPAAYAQDVMLAPVELAKPNPAPVAVSEDVEQVPTPKTVTEQLNGMLAKREAKRTGKPVAEIKNERAAKLAKVEVPDGEDGAPNVGTKTVTQMLQEMLAKKTSSVRVPHLRTSSGSPF